MRARSVRAVVAVAAMTGPWAGVVALAGPSAAAGAAATAVCHGVKGTAQGRSATLTRCTKAATGGSGVIKAIGRTGTDLVTWTNGGTTTIKFRNAKPVAPDACASGFGELHIIGTVTASTGPSAGISGGVSALLCEPTSLKGPIHLLPGTLFRL